MSELPARPSLSHLRKQAKELLRRLRQQNPDATLTDAQHALATEYGFASWPKLKAHVESLASGPPPATFQRYTPKAREALFFSRCEASRSTSRTLEPGHVLLGLIRVGRGLEGTVFEQLAGSLHRAGIQMTPEPIAAGDSLFSPPRVAAGDRARQIFRAAAEEADALKHQRIGLAHLLLGVLREPDPVAATVLDGAGMHPQLVRDEIERLLKEE